MKLITKELIKELYTKYNGTYQEGGRDSWDVSSDIVNELVTREDFPGDPEYYFHVYEVVSMVKEYLAEDHRSISND